MSSSPGVDRVAKIAEVIHGREDESINCSLFLNSFCLFGF